MLSLLLAIGLSSAPEPASNWQKVHASDGRKTETNDNQNLPYANGRRFRSLDAYLAYRKELGKLDRPFYEEIAPGRYQLVKRSRMSGEIPETYTRKQLMQMFGFRK